MDTTIDVVGHINKPEDSTWSITIAAAYVNVQLSFCYSGKSVSELTVITSSREAEQYFRTLYDPNQIALKEFFYFLILNRANRVIAAIHLSTGGTSSTICDVRLIMQYLIALNASGIICSHNHPSGQLKPSEGDNDLNRKIKRACELFDIRFCDHLILSPETGEYYSFADEGTF